MIAADRRSKLLEIVQRQGFASLPDLAESLDVSESTVRRDLAHLEKQGSTKRTHGGAFYTGPSPHMPYFRHRQTAQWDKKKAIAAAAAKMVDDADTLLLDGGSTTYELARVIAERTLQVVTNSLPVANLLSSATNVDLILIGGYVHTPSGAVHGPFAEQMLGSLGVRKAFLSAAGINQRGLYNSNYMLAQTQRAMALAAEQVIVLVDSTKFGHQSLAHICELKKIDRVVSDHELEQSWRKQLTDLQIELTIAEELPAAPPDGSPTIDSP